MPTDADTLSRWYVTHFDAASLKRIGEDGYAVLFGYGAGIKK